MNTYTTERIHRSLVVCRVNFEGPSNPFYANLQSDWHWDNPKCLRKILRKHLEEAKKKNAPIFLNGDIFCAMQGKGDPRGSKSDIREEHNKADYLNALVNTAAEWMAPYASNIVAIGEGNHETAVLKNKEFSLIPALVGALNAKTGSNIHAMGYGYWVKFKLNLANTRGSINTYITHGSGGGGPVTKGVIQTNRRAVYLPDANYIVSGHVHEGYAVPIPRFRLSQYDRVYHDTAWHLCTPTFKEEFSDNTGGFHTERGRPPKPIGSYDIEMWAKNDSFKHRPLANIESNMDATVKTGEDTREMSKYNDEGPKEESGN